MRTVNPGPLLYHERETEGRLSPLLAVVIALKHCGTLRLVLSECAVRSWCIPSGWTDLRCGHAAHTGTSDVEGGPRRAERRCLCKRLTGGVDHQDRLPAGLRKGALLAVL